VEIAGLRRQVFDLESAMRELQMAAVQKEEKHIDQVKKKYFIKNII